MAKYRCYAAALAGYFATAAWLPAQRLKPESVLELACYAQSAESRMSARKTFLVIDSDQAQAQQLMRGAKIQTVPGNGANPHKIQGAMLYDWVGTVFIPGATLD